MSGNAASAMTTIGVRANFFLGGVNHLCPKKFFDSAQKTAMLTCKITLPNSLHPVIISKNPRFRALYLARRNELRFFRLINIKIYFWLLVSAQKISLCPKNNGFAWVRGAAPPGPLARTPMVTRPHFTCSYCKFHISPSLTWNSTAPFQSKLLAITRPSCNSCNSAGRSCKYPDCDKTQFHVHSSYCELHASDSGIW